MGKALFILAIILVLVDSCTKKSRPQKTEVIDAASVFSGNCARCHGPDGISGHAPNLAKTDLDRNGVIDQVTKGEGRMPAFEDKLSRREIAAVADYVLALKK